MSFNIVGTDAVNMSNGVPPNAPSSKGAGGTTHGRSDSAITGLKAQSMGVGTRGRDMSVINAIKARG